MARMTNVSFQKKDRELGECTVTEFVVEEEEEIFIPEEKDDT